jgi:hypothetical protein
MEYNPYAPPQVRTEMPLLREAAPRPVAVWLMIAWLLVFVLFFVIGAVRFVGAAFAHWGEIQSFGLLVGSLAWRLALIAAFLAAIYSLYYRHTWSRWLGVILIVGFAAFMIFRPDTTSYDNDAERVGGNLGRLIIFPLLFWWWAYALAFSSKAKRYFSKPSSDPV